MDFSTTLKKIAISKFWSEVSGEMMGVRGHSASVHFRLFKRALALSIFSRIVSFWSDNDHTFNKNLLCPQGITYNLCPEGWGAVILKDIVSWTFNYVEQNGYLKIFIGCFLRNGGRGRGLVALLSLSTIKKGTSCFNFWSNEPFLKFLRQLLRYEVPWSKTNKLTK